MGKIDIDDAFDSLAVYIANIFRSASTEAEDIFYRKFNEHQRLFSVLKCDLYDSDQTFNDLILSELKTLRKNYIKITQSRKEIQICK